MVSKRPSSLKKKSDFDALFEKGSVYRPAPYLLVRFQKTENGLLRYGVSLPSQVANSVVRNRIKRWIREYFLKSPNLWSLSADLHLSFRLPGGTSKPGGGKKTKKPSESGQSKALFFKNLTANDVWRCLDKIW